jgi:hypothetical protein
MIPYLSQEPATKIPPAADYILLFDHPGGKKMPHKFFWRLFLCCRTALPHNGVGNHDTVVWASCAARHMPHRACSVCVVSWLHEGTEWCTPVVVPIRTTTQPYGATWLVVFLWHKLNTNSLSNLVNANVNMIVTRIASWSRNLFLPGQADSII